MIVYELITNAARHAFAGASGEIRVAVWRDGTFVKCWVQDNGSAAVNIKPGHGLKIVDALSSALGARFTQTFGPRGSRSLLVFPCEAHDSSAKDIMQSMGHFNAEHELEGCQSCRKQL